MSATSSLRPGSEVIGLDGAKYPSAYSSFAISVDSREAENTHSPEISHEKPFGAPVSAMKHSKSSSASPDYGVYSYHGYGKRRDSGPDTSASTAAKNFGVRFTAENKSSRNYGQHHRRSSTAAVIEYMRRHLDIDRREKSSMALTAKRAFLMFCIVFSATYMALALLPLLSRSTGYSDRVKVAIRRGEGYYGNSNIFQGGNALGDPHAEGDEHSHYVAHQAVIEMKPAKNAVMNALEVKKAKEGSPLTTSEGLPTNLQGQRAEGVNGKLRSSTLADQAALDELRISNGHLTPIAPPAFEHVEAVLPAPAKLPTIGKVVDQLAAPMVSTPIKENKKPIMPFAKLKKDEKDAKAKQQRLKPVQESDVTDDGRISDLAVQEPIAMTGKESRKPAMPVKENKRPAMPFAKLKKDDKDINLKQQGSNPGSEKKLKEEGRIPDLAVEKSAVAMPVKEVKKPVMPFAKLTKVVKQNIAPKSNEQEENTAKNVKPTRKEVTMKALPKEGILSTGESEKAGESEDLASDADRNEKLESDIAALRRMALAERLEEMHAAKARKEAAFRTARGQASEINAVRQDDIEQRQLRPKVEVAVAPRRASMLLEEQE